ncbi:MAG: hypothetical protein EA424_02885 [Planctomycetaceae bacterium]|nr:MAG: hypothetical protein EA424_02885 [Planctomycetaceae bacterium]
MPVAIPPWDAMGVLPPLNEANPTSPERSPYVVTLTDVVLRFGTSRERCRIMDGFLRYRGELHGVGLTQGFQWLDGSFLECVETLESRDPRDIDLVTFFRLSRGDDPVAAHPDLFPSDRAGRHVLKQQYFVDNYFLNLDTQSEKLVRQTTYWYSLWSHRRDRIWRGFVQVDLSPTDDPAARALLATLSADGA